MNMLSDISLAPMIQPTVGSAADLEHLGDQIAELSAHLDAAGARLLDLIREFDARGGWNTGFVSCAAWLTWRVGLDRGAARERVRVARALGTLPLLAQALARGELSYSKVRALTRIATPETEERLLRVGTAGTAEHVERIVRGWRRVDRQAEARETARRHARRGLHVYQDGDGMVVVRGRLDQEVFCRRWMRPARRFISGRAPRTQAPGPLTSPRKRPPCRSSTPTRWPSSRKRRFTTAWIPVQRASGTRSWFTSTPRSWRTRMHLASPSSRTEHTFPQKRLGAWRAMRAEW